MTLFQKILASVGIGAMALVPALSFATSGDNETAKRERVADKTAVTIAIANNGSTLVRGAKVTDVDADGDITATTVVNGVTMTWTVDTDAETDFVDFDSDTIAAADISENDYISFSGVLTGATAVDAGTVRDWSIDEEDEDGKDDNGKHNGFWNRFKNFPGVHFFMGAKAEVR